MLRASSGEQLRDLRKQVDGADGAKGARGSGGSAGRYADLPPAVASLARERDELRAEVARLEDELAVASASASRADAQQRLIVEGAESAAADVEALKRSTEADLDALREELKEARSDAEAAGERLKASNSAAGTLRAEAEDVRARLEGAQVETDGLRARLDGLKSELEASKREADELRSETEAKRTEATGLRAELEAARSEGGANAEAAQRDLDGLRAQLQTSTGEAEGLSAKLTASKSEADGLRAEVEQLRAQLASSNSQLDFLKEEADGLRSELQAAKEEVKGLGMELQASKDAADGLRSEVASAREEGAAAVASTEAAAREAAAQAEAKHDAALADAAASAAAAAAAAAEAHAAALRVSREETQAALATAEELRATLSSIEADHKAQMEAKVTALREAAAVELARALDDAEARAKAERETIIVKYKAEVKQRKKLYNELADLKGNIRVYARVRPLNQREVKLGSPQVTSFPAGDDGSPDDTLILRAPDRSGGSREKVFEFDRVYGPDSTQEDVFKDTEPVVTAVLDGYNVCVFAYGQTGSGKTYTMEGPAEDPGVNTRALRQLFRVAEDKGDECELTVHASCIEVYCENIRDLLAKKPSESSLEVKIDGKKGTYVPNLIEEEVKCVEDVHKLVARAKRGRSTYATNMNEHSSRSHSMLSVRVCTKSRWTGASTRGVLHLVDLAGSERVGKSEATGQRLKEAQAINKSLSALGDVIAALATSEKHVPFRNSKLTYYLQNALGGNSKVLMFCQASPAEDNASETSCSLLFATRARGVALGKATANKSSGGAKKGAPAKSAKHKTAAPVSVAALDSASVDDSADFEEKADKLAGEDDM